MDAWDIGFAVVDVASMVPVIGAGGKLISQGLKSGVKTGEDYR